MFDNNDINEFDQMMKSILDEGTEEVPAGVWDKISEDLDKAAQRKTVVLWWRRAAAGSMRAAGQGGGSRATQGLPAEKQVGAEPVALLGCASESGPAPSRRRERARSHTSTHSRTLLIRAHMHGGRIGRPWEERI